MKKKIVWVVILVGLWLPFILQTNFYPFFRFSMFAEPVQYSIQQEHFKLKRIYKSGLSTEFIPEEVGIQKSTLDYLLRNYYYRNDARSFLVNLKKILPDTLASSRLKIIRFTENDSTAVSTITLP